MPAGNVVFHDSMMDLVVEQLSAGMASGVRIAAPVIAALLLSNLVTGLISRTLPQINVLAIGLSINALAMLVILSVTIGSVGLVFQSELATVAAKLSRLW
ncbi:flagellar biosynthetic protein FliR [Rubripirellula sp.]|nr:flagellar biosynthetic protein FliR [Rubripirellula sp.]